MCVELKEAFVRPFHFFENDYSFKKLIDQFCAVPRSYPVRNKSEDRMQYFCEKTYFYRDYGSAFDNKTYKYIFEVHANIIFSGSVNV